jgi:hypothetical protein
LFSTHRVLPTGRFSLSVVLPGWTWSGSWGYGLLGALFIR